MSDRPLTDAQERALIALADRDDFTRPEGTQTPTLDVLARMGLVETAERPMVTVARITAKGREMLASMGD